MLALAGAGIVPVGEERLPLAEAGGRTLATDLRLDRPEPPLSRSAMDGFAVLAADGLQPRRLVATLYAGSAGQPTLQAGEAIAVMTGGTIPHGADAVVPVERSQKQGAMVHFTGAIHAGDHVRHAGEMGQPGDLALVAGSRLTPGALAVAASVGAASLAVCRRPPAAVFSTGDEVVAHDRPVAPHQVRDSNRPATVAMLAAAGAEVTMQGHVGDDPTALREALAPALERCRLLVTHGGVSMGEKDYLPSVFADLGVETIFHKLSVQPGKPLWCGRRGDDLVLGLPGNPVSSYVILSLFAPLVVHLLQGLPAPPRPWARPARLMAPVRSRARERFIPAWLGPAAEGDHLPQLFPLTGHGSGDWLSLGRAEVLLHLPPQHRAEAGDEVAYLEGIGGA